MADILKFQPSLNMASSDRNRAGYYNAMKDMISSLEEQLQAFGTLEYDDDNYKITLIPLAENLNSFTLSWEVTDANWYVLRLTLYGAGSDIAANSRIGGDNPAFYFYFNTDNNTFFCGFYTSIYNVGWSIGHNFNGDEVPFIFTNPANVYIANTNTKVYPTGPVYWEGVVSRAMCIKPYTVRSLGIINDIFYYFEGSSLSNNNNVGVVFTVDDQRYVVMAYNVLLKL